MRNSFLHRCGWMVVVLGCVHLVGCNGAKKPTEQEQFYPTPGRYTAAPLNATRPRVGIPVPDVQVVAGATPEARSGEDAADQLFWVADQSGRFNLIERERLAQMIEQQGMTGIIRPGALNRKGHLRGVDYLLICRISGLSISGVEQPSTVSVANAERLMHISTPPPRVTTTCRVEMRLIEPTTGAAAATVDDSFNRVCSPQAMGLNIPAPVPTVLHLSDDQINAVLRVVLDDALRRLLPEADAVLTLPASTNPAAPDLAAGAPSATELIHGAATTQPAIAKIHCPECGAEVSPDDEFCPNCGARLLLKGVRIKPSGK